MPRAQVELTRDQLKRLKALAKERGVPVEELIRQGVEEVLAEAARKSCWERALGVVGAFQDRTGAKDVAAKHDEYLTERPANGDSLR